MRDVKFRGQSQYKDHKWLYGHLVLVRENVYITPDDWDGTQLGMYRVIPETVGEFVGYEDRKGKEIYEDDIVLVDIDGKDVYMRVLFMLGGWKIHEKYDNTLHDLYRYVSNREVKVIGNMSNNPNLF